MRRLFAAFGLICVLGCVDERRPTETVRFATYNVYLNRPTEGQLAADLATSDNPQARKVAEIIQRAAPDVLLLNEFDYDEAGEGLRRFRENYLEVSQNGAPPAVYPYVFVAPSNTGLHSGHDLDRNGAVTNQPGSREFGGDAFGYGEFPGQFAMAVLSKYPIDAARVRTFQKFLWKDMPGAMLPDDPATREPADWYRADALEDFRLSSKSHWDVPILIDGARMHVLASHPTPPGFDGEEDRNGKRNHDEIRFWADYIAGDPGAYIYDDEGARGGLRAFSDQVETGWSGENATKQPRIKSGARATSRFNRDAKGSSGGVRFVIMGDLNADPNDGGAVPGAIDQLLKAPLVRPAPEPRSEGGAAQTHLQAGANLNHSGDPAEDSADFNDDPAAGIGNLHLDYVLPSKSGLGEAASGIFWPAPGAPFYDLVGPGYPVESSDHRLVWRDIVILQED